MGSNNSSQEPKQIGLIKFKQFEKLSLYLPKLLNESNFKRTGTAECQFCLPFEQFKGKFKLKATKQFMRFTQINDYAQLFTEERDKIFQGIFIQGKREGFGIQYDLLGNKLYEGYFRNNIYDGWGKTPYFEGQFSKGKKHGWGIYQQKIQSHTQSSSNRQIKVRYEGQWKQNKFHGYGALNISKKDIQRFLVQNSKIPLQGFEQKYVGRWSNGKAEGVGKLQRKSFIYVGQFSQGKFDGSGTLSFNDGRTIKGRFQRDVYVPKQK